MPPVRRDWNLMRSVTVVYSMKQDSDWMAFCQSVCVSPRVQLITEGVHSCHDNRNRRERVLCVIKE